MRLVNVKGEELILPDGTWAECLGLAVGAGWIPEGTAPPPAAIATAKLPEPWDGSYTDILGQELTRRDARNLGIALKKTIRRGNTPCQDIISMTDHGGFLLLPGAAPAELAATSEVSTSADADVTEIKATPRR